MQSAPKRRKIDSGIAPNEVPPSMGLNGFQRQDSRQFSTVTPRQVGWATANASTSAHQNDSSAAVVPNRSVGSIPTPAAFKIQNSVYPPTLASSKMPTATPVVVQRGRENVPPSNFSSSSSSGACTMGIDANEEDVFVSPAENQTRSTSTGRFAQYGIYIEILIV
jgi:hypothetical protein